MKIQNVIFGKWFIQYEVCFGNWSKFGIIVRIEAISFTCIHRTGVYVTRYKNMNVGEKRSTRWLE